MPAIFVGAEGYGTDTLAARDPAASVIKVTNLNNSGVGSFRAAVTTPGKRYVVFEVAGVINITSAIQIEEPDLYVLGQTSFRENGQGILITGEKVRIKTHDVVFRYMRFAATAVAGAGLDVMDSLDIIGNTDVGPDFEVYNLVFDHCCFFWSVDECVSIGNATSLPVVKDITFQKCMIFEGLSHAGHSEVEHSKGLLVTEDCSQISIHSCLFAHHTDRSPRSKSFILELYNNVIYNWGMRATYIPNAVTDPASEVNIIGNTWFRGPNTTARRVSIQVQNTAPPPASLLYLSDNLGNGDDGTFTDTPDENATGWNLVANSSLISDPAPLSLQSLTRLTFAPLPPFAVTIKSRINGYNDVLNDAGASLYRHPDIEVRIANDVINRTGSIIDNPSEVGGIPTIGAMSLVPTDTSGDGMPDDWKTANGLNPAVFEANAFDLHPDYPNLEVYANEVAGDPPLIGPGPPTIPPVLPWIKMNEAFLVNYHAEDLEDIV